MRALTSVPAPDFVAHLCWDVATPRLPSLFIGELLRGSDVPPVADATAVVPPVEEQPQEWIYDVTVDVSHTIGGVLPPAPSTITATVDSLSSATLEGGDGSPADVTAFLTWWAAVTGASGAGVLGSSDGVVVDALAA